MNKEDIKKTTLEYCVDNLKNNVPDADVRSRVMKRIDEQQKKILDKS